MNELLSAKSLKKVKLSDQISSMLKKSILNGDYSSGDRLPSESELSERFSVSKVTVREALHKMEAEGLIEKRQGIFGGSFVSKPGVQKIEQVLSNYHLFAGLPPEELVEFRTILETELIAIAVERRTKEDLAEMKKNIIEVEENINKGTPDQAKGLHFHYLIAQACHNRWISALMGAMIKIFLDVLSKVPMTLEDTRGDLEYNKQFYDFMLNRQKDEARQLMVRHFETLSEIIEKSKKGNVVNVHEQ